MRRALICGTILVLGLLGAYVPSASGEPNTATEPEPTAPSTGSVPVTDPPSTTLPPEEPTTTTSPSSTTSVPPSSTTTTTTPTDAGPVGTLDEGVDIPSGAVNEAPEFATRAWSNPWDMSASDDMLTNFGPMYNTSSVSFGAGALAFFLNGNGYVSPLWTGFPGSLQIGRDGTLPENTINANTYQYFSIRIHSSRALSGAAIFWSNCNRHIPSCEGGMPISLAGLGDGDFHTYTFKLANNPGFGRPRAWSGSMHGLRLALNAAAGPTPRVNIDWIRLYQGGQSGMLTGAAAGSELYYTGNGATCEELAGVGNTDLSALPPGTYRFSTSSNCNTPTAAVNIVSRPIPVVTAPNAAGGKDYATTVLKNPWNFSGPGDVSRLVNVCGTSYSRPAGAYSGYNCYLHKYINDPQVYMNIGKGSAAIQSSVYHRATVTFTYDGAFDLHNACGAGTIARVVWFNTLRPGKVMQTKDWVTYKDRTVYTFDLAAPTSQLNEEGATNKYPFVLPSNHRVTIVRWDPSEDLCSRRFQLHDFKLAADHAPTAGRFNITWRDARAAAGDKVSIYVLNTSVPGSTYQQIASNRPNSATGTAFNWNTAGFARGKYRVLLRVFRNGTTYSGEFTATGPVTF